MVEQKDKKFNDMACSCKTGSLHEDLFNLTSCDCNIEIESNKWEKKKIKHIGAMVEKVKR